PARPATASEPTRRSAPPGRAATGPSPRAERGCGVRLQAPRWQRSPWALYVITYVCMQLRHEQPLHREKRVPERIADLVRSPIEETNLADVPDRPLTLLDRAGEHRVERRRDSA